MGQLSTYLTRAQADPMTQLVETMSVAAYESTRTPSFPCWADVSDGYQADMRKSIRAALKAAERAGWKVVKS